ncbi:MAG: hypothetical protein ACTHOO_08195 [Alcanivorax sp.]
MSIQYVKSLLYQSSQIQNKIEAEQKCPLPNWTRLLRLKKIRLSIKDHLEALSHNHAHAKLRPIRIQSHDRIMRKEHH